MRKNIQKSILIISVTLMFAVILSGAVSAADGDTIYVATNGSDDNNGYSWDTAKLSIGNAIGTVNQDGTIYIANGLYTGENNTGITIDKNMNIIGQSKTGTIINGTDSNRIFYIDEYVTVTIQNLTFANGTSNEGGAIYNNGNLDLNNCIFTGNTATGDGGAIHDESGAYECKTNITGCTFINNSADEGGAIYNCCGDETITGCTFTGNHASDDGGAICNEMYLTANFNRFAGNTAGEGGDALYNYDGYTVNAEYNWWGSNDPDFDSLISGDVEGVDYTPWLYMTIAANPTTINNGETSLITVSFNNYSSDGTTSTPLPNPADGHIPDGTPVNFQTDLGTIGCKSIDKTTVGGIATAILTATELAGTAHVNATTDNQTLFVNVTINPKSSLYLTVTPSKTNPAPGDTVIYTLKVGNKGPDTAKDVIMTYVIPEGLEFAGANVDMGKWEYNPSTRTITWNISDVPKGDPYMWLSLRIVQPGQYLINPTLTTSTFDPTLNSNIQSITVNAAAQVNAASRTIGMQETGLPLVGLVLAVLVVLGGFVAPRKK